MTWEELKEKAKEMGYELKKEYTEYLEKCLNEESRITFYHYGDVCLSLSSDFCDITCTFSEDRTPDQMLAIMKALQ